MEKEKIDTHEIILLSLFPEGIPPQIYPKLSIIEAKIDELIRLCDTGERITASNPEPHHTTQSRWNPQSDAINRRIAELYDPLKPDWDAITKKINSEFGLSYKKTAYKKRFYGNQRKEAIRAKKVADEPREAAKAPILELIPARPDAQEPKQKAKAHGKSVAEKVRLGEHITAKEYAEYMSQIKRESAGSKEEDEPEPMDEQGPAEEEDAYA